MILQPKPCEIDGIVYPSRGAAARALGVTKKTISYRVDPEFRAKRIAEGRNLSPATWGRKRKYQKEHRQEHLLWARVWRLENSEYVRRQNAVWYAENRDYALAYRAVRRIENGR